MSDFDKNHVTFYLESIEDREKTLAAGRPIYRNAEYIRITPPGGNLIVEREVNDSDLHNYESRYRLWKEGAEEPVIGTHLRMWPAATPAMVASLKEIQVHTVEALADANDTILDQIGMGARDLQRKARTWLSAADDTGKLAERINALEIENESLKTRNTELSDSLETLKAEISRPRKGRPSADMQELQKLVA